MTDFFMVKFHPTKDLVMVQVGNNAIQLDKDKQERVYKILKERLEVKDNEKGF